MRSGCGHRLVILNILASMLKIYIYILHKCSCYHAGRTNKQTIEDRATQPLNWKLEFCNSGHGWPVRCARKYLCLQQQVKSDLETNLGSTGSVVKTGTSKSLNQNFERFLRIQLL